MKSLVILGAALVAGASGTPALAAAGDSAVSVTAATIAQGYGQSYSRADERAAVLERLNEVCKSPTAADHRRCAAAWKLIREARARHNAQ